MGWQKGRREGHVPEPSPSLPKPNPRPSLPTVSKPAAPPAPRGVRPSAQVPAIRRLQPGTDPGPSPRIPQPTPAPLHQPGPCQLKPATSHQELPGQSTSCWHMRIQQSLTTSRRVHNVNGLLMDSVVAACSPLPEVHFPPLRRIGPSKTVSQHPIPV